ncbi:MAG: hypothetical protein PHQ74_08890 [Crocinitomicaceae bacterium]|nr:hypothetical protein [Crocinitomicaceae bacterium]
MKKIVSIALLSIVCSFSYAQTSSQTTSIVKESNFVANKVKGEFNFQMPEGTSEEKIAKTANYYTEYFTVKYNPKTRMANIVMLQDKMRGVVVRFLISNEIKTVSYDGKEYDVETFVRNFVQ